MSTTAAGPGPDPPATRSPIELGTSVEVRARFDGRWCAGFEVADRIEADSAPVTYRLRRTSAGVAGAVHRRRDHRGTPAGDRTTMTMVPSRAERLAARAVALATAMGLRLALTQHDGDLRS